MLQNLCRSLKNALRNRTCVILLIGLLAGGLVWLFAMQASPSLTHRFVVGQRLVFRLEYLSASASNFAGLAQDADKDDKENQAIYTNVEADLHATVVDAKAEGAWIAFALRKPEVQVAVNGELAMIQADTIATDLTRTLLAQIDPQGRILAVHVDPRVHSLSHTFARALLATTQVVLSRNPALSAWETREHDPNGEYGVRYTRDLSSLESNVAVISKVRTKYVPAERAHSIRILDVNSLAQPSGQLTIRFDEARGHVQSVAGREATTIQVDGKTVARVETTLRMSFLRTETLSAADQKSLQAKCADLKDEPALALSTAAANTTQEAIIHRNELGDATVDSVLAELASFEAKADPNGSDTQLYFKLKALVYLHPEACPQLAKVLSAAGTKSRTLPLLMDALSSIGHAAAQSALQMAIRARLDDTPALAVLVPALAMVERPTLAAEEALRELAARSPHTSIRAGAELGLGTMAHQLAGADPERSLGIALPMAQKLTTASSGEAQRHLLFVLGNAGVAETLDVIVPFLKAPSAEVRAAAAAALRWIKAANVDELLCTALATDADAPVRLEAATALGFRTMTQAAFTAQKQAFLKDESTNVRLALLQNIARAQTAFPEGRTLLTQATSDPTKDVRDEAAGLLAID